MPFVQRVVTPIYISRSTNKLQQQDTVVSAAGGSSEFSRQQNVNKKNNGSCSGVIVPSITISTTKNIVNNCIGGISVSDSVSGSGSINGISENENEINLIKKSKLQISSKKIQDNELEAVTNLTLSNSLKQLHSLVNIAQDIFNELNKELQDVCDNTKRIKLRITKLQKKVDDFDPKLVTVPEGDLESFVLIKNHFKSKHLLVTSLFTIDTRSETLQRLYDGAGKTPVNSIREMDRIFGQQNNNDDDEYKNSDIFLCTPILGQTRKRMRSNIDVEIETRLPAVVDCLRKWTSTEAIGDITVTPDCVSRVNFNNNNVTQNNLSGFYNNTTIQQITDDITTDITDNNTLLVNNNRNENTDDLPLDHRLPSPEEQCQIIALKFPAEVIQVDTSGRRFDRMSAARKSILHIQLGISSPVYNQNIDNDTVKRRSRSRKPRGKRRNTIAGTDQKEIEEAANGDLETSIATTTTATTTSTTGTTIKTGINDLDGIITQVPRSKSSDILKKDSLLLSTYNIVNETSKTIPRTSHFNTLKQWGKNRLKFMNRSNEDKKLDKDKVSDINDHVNVFETVVNRRKFLEKERKLSHERKPSYSSSEKSLTIIQHQTLPASINPVKLRESSSIRRQRRNGGIDYKEEPHSSSGNWSASSESGRTSIGSEITTQPKSSASSNSLNHTHHLSSGPPSSIISRRRFLNTSASSSITSEGTVTPDLQVHDLYDDETSSSYSCDTEGYYTSFHIDSGLKTLKEEEPVTPLHTSSALSSNNSFGSSSNQTVLSAENEYELFGRGSTSTTTSSAGTVCTTMMAGGSDRNLVSGPAVPERKSSLSKLNRSNSSASGGSLERSYSSSTVGSTLERTGTIKRNGILLQKEVAAIVHQTKKEKQEKRIESPDSGNNTSSSPAESNTNSSPTHGLRSNSEFEYSESSDLEGVDRMERIRVKTTINTSRIPSMCVITPLNSDDESQHQQLQKVQAPKDKQQNKTKLHETDLDSLEFKKIVPKIINDSENKMAPQKPEEIKKEIHHLRKARLLPLNNMLGKLRTVLPHLKKSPNKDLLNSATLTAMEPIYDSTGGGEYVTIADVRNNNKKKQNGVYYSNDIVKRNLATVLSGNLMNEETEYVSLNELPCNIRCESNLLLHHSNNIVALKKNREEEEEKEINNINKKIGEINDKIGDEEKKEGDCVNIRGARVLLDAQGKVVYNSDSLKRRKGAHTTFSPGPCVKDPKIITTVQQLNNDNDKLNTIDKPLLLGNTLTSDSLITNRKVIQVRPVIKQQQSIQVDKSVIRVQGETKQNAEIMRMTPKTTVVASTGNHTSSSLSGNNYITSSSSAIPSSSLITTNNIKGAYVNLQENSMGNDKNYKTSKDYQHLFHDVIDSPMTQSFCVQSTLSPRSSVVAYSEYEDLEPQPFQRNNLYWTLQTRKGGSTSTPISSSSSGMTNIMTKDDITTQLLRTQQNVPIEDLYSTPNKNRKHEQNLKTTPLGFSTFFSPITKAQEFRKEYDDVINVSPIDPRNSCTFKTSTPSKMDEHQRVNSPSRLITEELRNKLRIHESGQRSNNSSPLSSGRSTPRGILEPQTGRNRSCSTSDKDLSQTCSDRLGQSKTTLLDFKKLLLAQAGKATTSTVSKSSAVELLKAVKSPPHSVPIIQPKNNVQTSNVNSNMNILDLSGSPKTFANNRRLNRQMGNPSSPSKSSSVTQSNSNNQKHYSPRAGWRLQNTRSDIMSIAIPEVNSEEDISPCSSVNHGSTTSLSPIKESTVVEEKLNIRDNIFLKTEENNFMKHELNQKMTTVGYQTSGISRSQYLQAQRAQFLMGNNNNHNKQQIPVMNTAQFKNGHYTGMSSNTNVNKYSPPPLLGTNENPPFVLPTTNNPSAEYITAQSLETAL